MRIGNQLLKPNLRYVIVSILSFVQVGPSPCCENMVIAIIMNVLGVTPACLFVLDLNDLSFYSMEDA